MKVITYLPIAAILMSGAAAVLGVRAGYYRSSRQHGRFHFGFTATRAMGELCSDCRRDSDVPSSGSTDLAVTVTSSQVAQPGGFL